MRSGAARTSKHESNDYKHVMINRRKWMKISETANNDSHLVLGLQSVEDIFRHVVDLCASISGDVERLRHNIRLRLPAKDTVTNCKVTLILSRTHQRAAPTFWSLRLR